MAFNPQNISYLTILNISTFRLINSFEVNNIIMSLKNKPSNIKTYSVKIFKFI